MINKRQKTKQWIKDKQQDIYVQEAKKLGYRSRAAFKLIAIQEKYKIIKPGMCVLDCGAAPGSWSQMAIKWTGPSGKVIGCDLLNIKPLKHLDFIQGDLNDPITIETMLAKMPQNEADVIISDMAPNTTGHGDTDAWRSIELCELVFNIAKQHLKKDGNIAMKLFQGSGFDPLVKEIRSSFQKVVIFKPPASKSISKEVYLIGIGKK